jgi:hypothetical protein
MYRFLTLEIVMAAFASGTSLPSRVREFGLRPLALVLMTFGLMAAAGGNAQAQNAREQAVTPAGGDNAAINPPPAKHE